jgi:hypothetical protein
MKPFKLIFSRKKLPRAFLAQMVRYLKAIPRNVQFSMKGGWRSPSKRQSFLELPPEIRNLIYTYCLCYAEGDVKIRRETCGRNSFSQSHGRLHAPHLLLRQFSQGLSSDLRRSNIYVLWLQPLRNRNIFDRQRQLGAKAVR